MTRIRVIIAIFALLLLTGCSNSNLLGVADDDILNTTLTEVPLAYEVEEVQYINNFKDRNTGEVISQKIDKIEYEKLGLPNADQPSMDGADWLSSSGGVEIYSSTTVPLSDYQYMTVYVATTATSTLLGAANDNVDMVKIKLPGMEEQEIEKEHIKSNKIDKAGLELIKSKSKK